MTLRNTDERYSSLSIGLHWLMLLLAGAYASLAEQRELAAIYVERGLEPGLATQVAEQLMAHDALAAHARDELGMSTTPSARPVQAALASAASFSGGAVLPLLVAALLPQAALIGAVAATSLVFLALLGAPAARAGGAAAGVAAARVSF